MARGDVQRWASLGIGACVVALVGWLTLDPITNPRVRKTPDAGVPSSTSSSTSGGGASEGSKSPSHDADGGFADPSSGSQALQGAIDGADGGFLALPFDLGDAGTLPSGAPRSVRIGVVLVQFVGAEGAATSTRKKADALAVAQRLSDEAKPDKGNDFRKAVSGGDPGSSEDIGRIPRGVLDRATEASVFALSKGEISEVLETPRGYWIVKRIE